MVMVHVLFWGHTNGPSEEVIDKDARNVLTIDDYIALPLYEGEHPRLQSRQCGFIEKRSHTTHGVEVTVIVVLLLICLRDRTSTAKQVTNNRCEWKCKVNVVI